MTDERKNRNGSAEDRRIERLKLWQMIVRDVRFTIPILITAFGGVAYNFEAVRNVAPWNNTEKPPPIASGETVVPQGISPEVRQSLDSFDAAITKLQKNYAALAKKTENQDKTNYEALDSRVKDIEAVVQP
jgi:hypothetical protein